MAYPKNKESERRSQLMQLVFRTADDKRKQSNTRSETFNLRHDGWLTPQVRFQTTTKKELSFFLTRRLSS